MQCGVSWKIPLLETELVHQIFKGDKLLASVTRKKCELFLEGRREVKNDGSKSGAEKGLNAAPIPLPPPLRRRYSCCML